MSKLANVTFATLIAALTTPISHAAYINFDDIEIGSSGIEVMSSTYRDLGVVFAALNTSTDVRDDAYVILNGLSGNGAVSLPNALAFGGPEKVMEISFVDPATGNPAYTDFVEAVVGDRSPEVDPITMTAYDADGNVLDVSSFSSTYSGHFGAVSVAADGIYRVVVSNASPSGADIDNLVFNTPVAPPDTAADCEGLASYSVADGVLQLPLMEVSTVPLLGASGRPAGDPTVPVSATLRIIPGTTLFEIESVISASPDSQAASTCHAVYALDGTLTIPVVDVPVVTAIGGLTVTTGMESYSATLELLPMGDLFTLTGIQRLP